MLTDQQKQILNWIKKNKDVDDLHLALDNEVYEKLFTYYPNFLIWLWEEEYSKRLI